MKGLILYSSKTGNTKKLAHTIADDLAADYTIDIRAISDAKGETGVDYDFVLLGGWVNRAMPDKKTLKALKHLKPQTLGLFLTMGADPASPHGQEVVRNVEALIAPYQSLGWGICRGTVDQKVMEQMNRLPDLIVPRAAKDKMNQVARDAREATDAERHKVAADFHRRIATYLIKRAT